MIQFFIQLVVLIADFTGSIVRRLLVKKLREIDLPVFRMRNFALPQLINPTYHLIHGAKSKLGHQFSNFVRYETHIVDHMSWLTRKLGPEPRVLGCDAHRTSIATTFT